MTVGGSVVLANGAPFFFVVDRLVAHRVYLCQHRLQGGTNGKAETIYDVPA